MIASLHSTMLSTRQYKTSGPYYFTYDKQICVTVRKPMGIFPDSKKILIPSTSGSGDRPGFMLNGNPIGVKETTKLVSLTPISI